jgi:ZIP family zinc transporter
MGAATVETALALTMMGAMGTGLGGLMVVVQPNMSFKRLGVLQVQPDELKQFLIGCTLSLQSPCQGPPTRPTAPPLASQGLAAGLMLCISMIDLLPAAIDKIGFVQANLCFYAGVLFFAAIVYLMPEPSPASIKMDAG